jgi:hypothetical protein
MCSRAPFELTTNLLLAKMKTPSPKSNPFAFFGNELMAGMDSPVMLLEFGGGTVRIHW